MELLEMLTAKIKELEKEYTVCINDIDKKSIAHTLTEFRLLKYEYEFNNGLLKYKELYKHE